MPALQQLVEGDTVRLTNFGAVRFKRSLHLWCMAFGINSSKDGDVDGTEVDHLLSLGVADAAIHQRQQTEYDQDDAKDSHRLLLVSGSERRAGAQTFRPETQFYADTFSAPAASMICFACSLRSWCA